MAGAAVWYCTREQVKAAADVKETARNNDQVDRLIAGSTDSIESDQLFRRFYPQVDTRTFEWPCEINYRYGTRTFSLGRDELVSVTTVMVDGVVVGTDHYTLLPINDGPPYTHIEFDSLVTTDGVDPRPISIVGVYGFWDREDPAGTLAASVDDTTTAVLVANSAAVGVGHLLLVGTERMFVTDRSMTDTGQNLTGNLTASNANEVVPVSSGAAFGKGETILIDAEKMRIVEIAGNNLIVKRPWDGSTLAAHTTGADIYAPRQLTVQRGVLGTSAAAHNNASVITKHRIPPLVNELGVAEAMIGLSQESTQYGRTIGAGDSERPAAGAGIEDLRRRAWEAYGRKAL